jgi:MarR family transcriptional regulator, organic hydroperoxide resistance regulator
MTIKDDIDRERVANEVASLLSPLVRDLQGNFRACAEADGLALSEAQALWLLSAGGPLTTKELAQRLRIDPANASTLVTRLDRRGLVHRQPAPRDRRRRLIALTAAGRESRARLTACMAERGPSFAGLTTGELVTFRDLLRRLAGRS